MVDGTETTPGAGAGAAGTTAGAPAAQTPEQIAAAVAAAAEAAKTPEQKAADEKAAAEALKTPEQKAADEKAAQAEAMKTKTYTLKLPEKSALDATVTERTTAIARELGLSTDDAAQKVLDFTHQEVAKAIEATVASHQPGGAEWTKQTETWKAAAFADPELGDGKQPVFDATVAKAKVVLEKFAPPGLIEFLHNTGYGSNPDVLRFLSKIAKASGDGSFITGAGGTKPAKSTADTIYGETPTPSGASS